MKRFLDKVRSLKEQEVEARRKILPEAQLHQKVDMLSAGPSFENSLKREKEAGLSIIAEVKTRAPGRHNIAELDLPTLISEYEEGGVDAISVLTDETYFGGSLEILEQTRQQTQLPLLHKEFVISFYQMLEGRLRGANGVLLLAYYFSKTELSEMISFAESIGLAAVVECSLEEELPKTLSCNPKVLLLNNRPIASIPEDPTQGYDHGSIERGYRYWDHLPLHDWKAQGDRIAISASCIDAATDLRALQEYPLDAVLVGNAVASASNRISFLQQLRTCL